MQRKKWLAMFVVAVMVCMMLPMTALAAGTSCTDGCTDPTHVAAIGTKHYTTITDAIAEAADGSNEIKLLQNTTEALMIAEGKDIVLDLNGKTLTTNIALYGVLEVKDTVGSGLIVNSTETGYTKSTITINTNAAGSEAATFTLTNGTVKTVKSTSKAVNVFGSSSKSSGCFIMNGGTLISSNSGTTSSALYGNAYSNTVINGGTIRNETNQANTNYFAVYCTSNAYLTINDGRFEGQVKSGGQLKNEAVCGGIYTIAPVFAKNIGIPVGYILIEDETTGWKVVPGAVDETNAGASLTIGSTTTYYKTAKDALAVLGTQEGTLRLDSYSDDCRVTGFAMACSLVEAAGSGSANAEPILDNAYSLQIRRYRKPVQKG